MPKLLALASAIGWIDAALFAIGRALEVLSGGRARLLKYHFMAQPVPPAVPRKARSSGIVVDEVRAGDPRLALLDRPADEIGRRYATGSRCFAAWQAAELAGFLWFTDGGYDEDEVRYTFQTHPADDAVWDLDVHIVPRYRLGRTFALLWEGAFAAMRARGVRWTVSRVSAFKPDSIRAHQRLGAVRTGWALFLLLGPYQITLTSLGQLKCRRLEHGPYPTYVVRAPAQAGRAAVERSGEPSRREDEAAGRPV